MATLLAPLFIIVLYVLVRSIDLLIGAALARSWGRVIAYGVVALLSILAELVALGVHL